MLSLVLLGSLLAVSPPVLPPEPAPAPIDTIDTIDTADTADTIAVPEGPAPDVAPQPPQPVIGPETTAEQSTLPVADEVGVIVVTPPAGDAGTVGGDNSLDLAVIDVEPRGLQPMDLPAPPAMPRMQAVPQPPWSGAGRFVGGAVMLTAGLGLLTAATMEFADGRDTTQPVVSQVPAGISMLVAGGVMIGTGVRDQHRLSEWEAATRIDAKPMGTGLIVGGVTAVSLGSMAAVVTAIASDMDLNAPRSLPAGWATAGVALGGGTAMLIAGIVRRAHYGKWRNGVTGIPMVAPTRAGATVGLVGRF